MQFVVFEVESKGVVIPRGPSKSVDMVGAVCAGCVEVSGVQSEIAVSTGRVESDHPELGSNCGVFK